MEQYTVTGMSCAACTARVEKAVSGVKGVTSCSVSLLTNSMGVEGTASAEEIIAAVRDAGYEASLKNGNKDQTTRLSSDEDALKDKETPVKKTVAHLSGILDCTYVCFHGAYDVGLATAAVFQ